MKDEKILKIRVDTFKTPMDDWQSFDGYIIETDQQTIKFGIDNGQSCCEDWGYFSTDDDIKKFEGANLLGIDIVDNEFTKQEIDKRFEYGLDGGGIVFIDIKTSKGTLTLSVYNSHNGYYGHDYVLVSRQLKEQETI